MLQINWILCILSYTRVCIFTQPAGGWLIEWPKFGKEIQNARGTGKAFNRRWQKRRRLWNPPGSALKAPARVQRDRGYILFLPNSATPGVGLDLIRRSQNQPLVPPLLSVEPTQTKHARPKTHITLVEKSNNNNDTSSTFQTANSNRRNYSKTSETSGLTRTMWICRGESQTSPRAPNGKDPSTKLPERHAVFKESQKSLFLRIWLAEEGRNSRVANLVEVSPVVQRNARQPVWGCISQNDLSDSTLFLPPFRGEAPLPSWMHAFQRAAEQQSARLRRKLSASWNSKRCWWWWWVLYLHVPCLHSKLKRLCQAERMRSTEPQNSRQSARLGRKLSASWNGKQ